MEYPEKSVLKIYTSSTDRMGTKLFYEHIVHLAKEKGIAGVTVYRGIMGYGMSSSHISTSRFWELTEKLPVMIEMVDSTAMLEEFYKSVEAEVMNLKKGILITLEPVKVILMKPGKSKE